MSSSDGPAVPPVVRRWALVGEVVTAGAALRGLVRAERPPVEIITTDIGRVAQRSGMHGSYYADLAAAGRGLGVPVTVLDDVAALAPRLVALDLDCAWVIGWPYLVRSDVLDVVPCIGMHPTRLPRRRGGAPINWPILDGESASAVSLLRLREGVDAGELLAQREFAIGPDDYASDVLERVNVLTEELVCEAAVALQAGRARWVPQDDRCATYTRRRRPEDGRIQWSDSAPRIRNLVRAVSRPFPGAFTTLAGEPLVIQRAEIPVGFRAPLRAEPGTILDCREDGVLIGTRDNALLATEIDWRGAGLTGDSLRLALEPHRGAVLH